MDSPAFQELKNNRLSLGCTERKIRNGHIVYIHAFTSIKLHVFSSCARQDYRRMYTILVYEHMQDVSVDQADFPIFSACAIQFKSIVKLA